MAYEDQSLACKDCGKNFTWTGSEQEFYAQKGFQQPLRCPDCRQKMRERKAQGQQQTYDIICKECGQKGTVPFKPRDPSSVLCQTCWDKQRQGGAPAAAPTDDTPKDEPKEEKEEKEE